MLGIGETELVLIALFAFMIFGPDKLPGMGRTLGRALRQFRNAQEGFTQVVQTEIVDPAAEAMSDNPKRPTRRRSEEFEEDADIEVAEGEEAPRAKRTETFAERKKRLAEEKAAAAAAAKAEKEAAAAAAAAAESAEASDSDDDVESGASAQPAPVTADEPAAKTPAPSKPSAADLYSMKRPSREASAVADSGVSPVASREASEERSDERRADGGDPGVCDGATPDEPKEA